MYFQIVPSSSTFLSTPSARRATEALLIQSEGGSDFYPRPPRGGRPSAADSYNQAHSISIHALREEGDVAVSGILQHLLISIHALREEGDHAKYEVPSQPVKISIHALREEGDSKNRDKISIFKQIIQHSARI